MGIRQREILHPCIGFLNQILEDPENVCHIIRKSVATVAPSGEEKKTLTVPVFSFFPFT